MFNHSIDKEKPSLVFNGNYRGEVVDVQDPLKAGRIRVRVFGVYDDLPNEVIPWAIYADPFMGGGSNSGGFWVPDVGDHVWVFFENGKHLQPVYFAGAPAAVHFPSNKTDSSYPNNRVFKTKQGHIIEVDDSPGNSRIRIRHKSGSQTTMFDNGDVEEVVVGNFTRVVQGNFTETVQGRQDITVQGPINMRGSRIDFNL
jgi:uncharacterized protein involved in type VI secretion and phage assembly